MKNTLLLLLFLSLSLFSNAQTKVKKYKNEIGLSSLNVYKNYGDNPLAFRVPFTNFDQFSNGENEKPKRSNILPELYFSTLIYDDLKFRTSISYSRRTFENSRGFNAYESSHYQFYIAQGLQLDMFKNRKIIPYVGMDMMLHHQWSKNEQPTNPIGPWPIYDEFNNAQTFIDGRLLAGVRYKFAQRFSFSLESSATFRIAVSPVSRLSINYQF